MDRRVCAIALIVGVIAQLPAAGAPLPAGEAGAELRISPASFVLRGAGARQQVIVTGVRQLDGAGIEVDRTGEMSLRTETPSVLRVSAGGVVTPIADGIGVLVAEEDGLATRAFVLVVESHEAPAPSFEQDVEPVLARAGCDSGPCHGKARGQNGFQLSLLGFDPELDYRSLTMDLSGRRLNRMEPDRSLFLLKPTGAIPHGGGRRLDPNGPAYATLLHWIRGGSRRRRDGEVSLQGISVEPGERMLAPGATQQLIVTARYSDGSSRDVTHLAAFLSSESAVAAVNDAGLVKAGPIPGEAAVMARFLGRIATASIRIPLPGRVPHEVYAALPKKSFIDELVWKKLEKLGIVPTEPAGDATFIRRASIDVIGRLPSPADLLAFLADTASDKRERLVQRLLERPEYADHWASKWADLLRPNPYRVGIKAVLNLDAWLRMCFRENRPFDRFVRDIVTARGSTFERGPATIFRDRRSPDEIAPLVAQLFLGIRLECAKCHHHPFEAYGQEDFYGLAAFFARVGYKGASLSPPISGGEEVVFTAASGAVRHPITGVELAPKTLFGATPAIAPGRDPREALADWMLAEDNPYFARAAVNRVWAEVFGVGLVEPVDDLRATNPASNVELLDALAATFRRGGCDLKKLLRSILSSHVYGLASAPNARNTADTRNYSRHYRQRLRAEVLVDAVGDISGLPDAFDGMPPGSRAAEIWTHRTESISLDAFGRPDPNQDPPCQRTPDTSLVQALHLMNSRSFHEKITSDSGRIAALAACEKSPQEVVEQIYLLVYSRRPDATELARAVAHFDAPGASRRRVCEDLTWALLNTPEFVFKD